MDASIHRRPSDIFDFIAVSSKYYAAQTVLKLRFRTNVLKEYPMIGREVPDFESNQVRELIEGNYRIIYFVETSTLVHILGVIHGARDMTKVEFERP